MSSEVQRNGRIRGTRASAPALRQAFAHVVLDGLYVVIDAPARLPHRRRRIGGGSGRELLQSCNTGFDNPLRAGNPTARDRCRRPGPPARDSMCYRPASLKPARRSCSLGA